TDEPMTEEPAEEETEEPTEQPSTEDSSEEPTDEPMTEEPAEEETEEQPVTEPTEEDTQEAQSGEPADESSSEEEQVSKESQGTREIYRYDYNMLEGINLTPGDSEEQLQLLDKRVNRVMTSKIVDVEDMSEEEVMQIEEEVKQEEQITG